MKVEAQIKAIDLTYPRVMLISDEIDVAELKAYVEAVEALRKTVTDLMAGFNDVVTIGDRHPELHGAVHRALKAFETDTGERI